MLFPLLLLLPIAQADSARELVERLRSETVEERDEAEKRLKSLGRAAGADLERAARDGDQEVSGRAKRLLRILELRETLPPAFLKEFPGAEERLATGLHEWTKTFVEATRWQETRPAHPALKWKDLDSLAFNAVRGAETGEERNEILDRAVGRDLKSVVPALIEMLRDPSVDARRRAIEGLRDLEAFEAAPLIVELLRDPEASTSAGEAISRMRAWRALPRVLELLDDSTPATCRAAIEVVGQLRAREAVPKLRILLKHRDPSIRTGAIESLGRIGDRGSARAIADLAADPEVPVRRAVIEVLSPWDVPERVPVLLRGFEDRDGRAAMAAIRLAGELKLRQVVPAVLKLMQEGRAESYSTSVLGKVADRESIPELRSMLRHPVRNTRRQAIEVLGLLRAREAIPEVSGLLEDPDSSIRSDALESLARLEARSEVPRIAALLKDPTGQVRSWTIYALVALNAVETGPDILALLKDPNEDLSDSAITAIRSMKPAGSLKPLLELLGQGDEGRRGLVWRAALAVGGREAIPEFRNLLRSKESAVAADAIQILEELRAKEAHPDLVELLKNPNAELRGKAAEALGILKSKESLPEIVKLLDLPETRPHALRALWRLGDRAAVPAILKWTAESEPTLRSMVFQVLRTLGGPEVDSALLKMVNDPDVDLAEKAIQQLDEVRDAAPVLLRALEERGDWLWRPLLSAFGQLGAREAIPAIAKELHELPRTRRQVALSTLARLRARECLHVFRGALKDEAPGVVYAAADALGDLEDLESIPMLRDLLDHPDSWVRDSAARALVKMGVPDGVPILFEDRPGRLFELNRLRWPGTWKKLGEIRLAKQLAMSVGEMLAEIGRISGLSVEIEKPPTESGQDYLKAQGVWNRNGLASALDVLAEENSSFEVILESDRIRIVWKEEDQTYWRQWWEAEKGKRP